ncbi:RDD family protein [Kitasatospora sp. SolWspMP-SS2h]|uniref:RDD family protein n=1 Tax=Kitasatospora sp. SolWspMP-SS2h TaxID=1305729 RepID=UPI000DB8FA69|nr:RDD family protein [Kitasatospora sp. SolWspMP-SS2h]
MSELVTGEAVVLGLRTAQLPSRALARLLDWVLYVLAYFVLSVGLMLGLSDLEMAAAVAFQISVLVFCTVLLPVLVETLSHGRSLGKVTLGLRVVRTDGGPIRFRHALVRGLVGVIDFGLFALPAVLSALISVQGRRLGDVFGGTMVVRERLPQSARDQGSVPPVPPQVMHALGADLVALDLSAVPDRLWLSSRQVLGRMHELDQPVAAGLGDRLAAEMAQRTGWPVPAGLPSLVYLGAVSMERQRREWERAAAAFAAYPAPGGHPVPAGYGAAPVQPAPPVEFGKPAPVPPAVPVPPAAPAAPVAPPAPAAPPEPAPGTGFAPPA